MQENLIELIGKEAGPTSIILVGVHGDERCGVQALENLLPTLAISKGRVWIGYGNPPAIQANVRYTEANLNRMFKPNSQLSADDKKSYEYGRAKFLKKYLDQASALLDVHASFTPDTQTFIICEDNASNTAKYLPMDLVVSGFDRVQPGGTDYYMNANGKIGICIECGYLGNEKSTKIAEESILAFLSARGHIERKTPKYSQSRIQIYDMYISKTSNFMLSKSFEDFEKISEGQLIGIDGQEEVRATRNCIILFARNREKIGDEAFLLAVEITK